MRIYTTFTVAAMIAVLATESAVAQGPPTEVTVGLHYGFEFSNGPIEDERIGVQGYVGLVGGGEARLFRRAVTPQLMGSPSCATTRKQRFAKEQ